jgi:tetratricopeptide (TPR) repeat protein
MIRPAALVALALSVTPPFRAEERHVRDGNTRLASHDPAGALRAYDDAERTVGPRAEIDLARGHAALARGDVAAAVDAWRRAAATGEPALASRALQNAGTALAAAGDPGAAALAFADALARDPSNEDARWDLEVVLRQRAGREAPPRDAAGALPSDRGEAGAPGGGDREEGRRQPAGEPERSDRARAARADAPRAPLGRQEAEALLDALRARERNAPPALRGGAGGLAPRDERRPDAAKDW